MLRVREYERVDIPLDIIWRNGRLDMFPTLERRGYFDVRISRNAIGIQGRSHVGVIPINERLTLEVVPRVPLGNLSHLLEVARYAPIALANAYRLYQAEGEMYPSLAVVYSAALRELIEHIADRGLLKDYDRVEEVTSFPRGRLNVTRTMQVAAARGITHRAASAWFHRTVDNPPNRCLLYAVERLSQYIHQISSSITEKQHHAAQSNLNYCWHQLQGVQQDWTEGFLRDGRVTGRVPLPQLRGYYRPALDLALLVIGRQALLLEQSSVGVELPSMVVDMTDVFERYARELLIAAGEAGHWPVVVLDGNKQPPEGGSGSLFDLPVDGIAVVATPDIVMRTRDGSDFPLLLEVKYKPAQDRPDRADLNQAISYAVAYRAPAVVLVQPRAEKSGIVGLQRLGRIDDVVVYRYVIDLAAKTLAIAETEFIESVRQLVAA